jgi:hypothetical protein
VWPKGALRKSADFMSLVNTFSLAGREESLQKSTYLSERLIILKDSCEQWKKGVGREIEAGDTAAHAGIES